MRESNDLYRFRLCFGGKLTVLKYPEKELVQVQAEKIHYAPGPSA